jgi:hypothetical protein
MMYFGRSGGGAVFIDDLSDTIRELIGNIPEGAAMAYVAPEKEFVGLTGISSSDAQRISGALHTTNYVLVPESYALRRLDKQAPL